MERTTIESFHQLQASQPTLPNSNDPHNKAIDYIHNSSLALFLHPFIHPSKQHPGYRTQNIAIAIAIVINKNKGRTSTQADSTKKNSGRAKTAHQRKVIVSHQPSTINPCSCNPTKQIGNAICVRVCVC
ncbi:hypothetical protein VTL71DRAFT_2175 [Oculimacula yallundae]|uniref:Uncharacterized protein n=1 Tax=Oculimacula yallundae TaxID=86028 RepID=A0ABR4C8A0_9HELO